MLDAQAFLTTWPRFQFYTFPANYEVQPKFGHSIPAVWKTKRRCCGFEPSPDFKVCTKMEGVMMAKPSHQVKFRRSCDVRMKMESVMKRQSQAHLADRESTADVKQPRQQLLLLPETISHKEQSGKAHHQHTNCHHVTEFTGNTFLTADTGEENSPLTHSIPDI